jgi:hypothetical protein
MLTRNIIWQPKSYQQMRGQLGFTAYQSSDKRVFPLDPGTPVYDNGRLASQRLSRVSQWAHQSKTYIKARHARMPSIQPSPT